MSDLGYCPTCQQPGVKRHKSWIKCLLNHWHPEAAFAPSVLTVRENRIEDYLKTRVAATGGETRKITWAGHPGAPDRLTGWPNGRHALVEVKRPGGTAEAHQVREHIRLRAMGFDVRVIDTREGVDDFVTEMTS